jgi:chromosome segregation ATPase
VTEINAKRGETEQFCGLKTAFWAERDMTDLKTTVASLHERLDAMREEIESDFANLFSELDQARGKADRLESAENDQDKQVKQLMERAEGQRELIETLTQEAEESRGLRAEVRERDLQMERLTSELASKNDLVKALRRQIEEADHLKATAKQADKKIFEQQHELDRKQKELIQKQNDIDRSAEELALLRAELETRDQRAADEVLVDHSEFVALQSELEARKSMIKSLKADARRAETLQAQLDEKRDVVNSLEAAIDRHSATISNLRATVDAWKAKYQAAKGEKLTDKDHTKTMTELPSLSDTEIDVLAELEISSQVEPTQTVAIDMRDALKEARRNKAHAKL